MANTERSSASRNLQTPQGEKIESLPHGFLLFDRQVQHHKDWVNLRQSSEHESLNDRIRELTDQYQQLSQQPGLKEQELIKEAHVLGISLLEAEKRAREAKEIYKLRPVKAMLYRVTRKIFPRLAERIIPFATTRDEVRQIRDRQRAIYKKDRKEAKRKDEQSLAFLESQTRSASSKFQELEKLDEEWLFSSMERTLFYALTNLSFSPKEREIFLLKYSRHSGLSIHEIKEKYTELASQAAPSIHNRSVTPVAFISQQDDKTPPLEVSFDYKPWTQTKDLGKPEIGQVENGKKRSVVLQITNKPVVLDDISMEKFDEIIRESGTPIQSDILREIIDSLSSTSNPIEMYRRYPHTVQKGDFKGYHVLKKERKGRVLFKYGGGSVYVRFADYYDVYADGSRWQG